MIISGIGPQAGAASLVGGASLPASPTFRQVYITPSSMSVCFTDGVWTTLEAGGTGEVTGSGITNRLTRWIDGAGSVLGDSGVADDGTNVLSLRPFGVGLGLSTPAAFPVGPKIMAASTVSTSPRGILSAQFSTDTAGARVGFQKARGTIGTPTTIVTGDTLGRMMFRGYDGTSYLEMGSIEITSNGTISTNQVPTQMIFSTATNANPSVLTAALTLGNDQSATFANSAQLGTASSVTGSLKLANASTANLTTIQGGNAASALTFVWPVVNPTSGQALLASAPSGSTVTLSWGAAGITNGAGANVIPKSDGTNLVASTLTDNATNILSTEPIAVGFGATTPPVGPMVMVASTASTSPRGILSAQFSGDTAGARVGFQKARGSVASPTTVVTGDTLGRLMFRGYDGTSYLEMGSIEIPTVGTIGTNRVPTNVVISTATDAATSVLTEAVRIKEDQTTVFAKPITVSVGATTSALTDLLINPTTKASGNLIDAQVNSVSKFKTDFAGISTGAQFIGTTALQTNADLFMNSNSARLFFGTSNDLILTRPNAANLQLGAVTGSGAAVAQILSVQGSSGASAAPALFTIAGSDQSGTTTTGGGVKIRGGNGTSAGGAVEIWTSATTTPGVAVSVGADKGVTLASLAGSGSRAVLADANGLLSAPVSDELSKEPLRDLPESYGIDMVMRLRPSIFKYRDKSRFGSQDYLGFGARETAKVLPEVTGQMKDGTYYLTDEKLVVVLTKAVQQQQKEIDELKAALKRKRGH